nr:NADH dehydrogenase subunit 3 [Scapholeberis mucronata]
MFHLLVFSSMTMLITSLVMVLAIVLAKKGMFNREKGSPFECGFDSNSSFRVPFSLRFFMITIIFLIFDVEVVLLLPAVYGSLTSVLDVWFNLFMMFLFILLFGLFHEWNQGALDWSH